MKNFLQKTMSIFLVVLILVGMLSTGMTVAAQTPPESGEESEAEILREMKELDPVKQKEEYSELKTQLSEIGAMQDPVYSADISGGNTIWNEYLEVAISNQGRFTIGNIEGNPNYSSDNNQILTYGHPSPGTSKTLIKIDGHEFLFEADSINVDNDNDIITANMIYDEVVITQILTFMENSATGRYDSVKISYSVINGGSTSRNIGIRVMLDTMLSYNDDAPFKVAGYGNVTKAKVLEGNAITQTYQVYDNLDNPTTMANGTLWLEGDRRPDKVQYCCWRDITDAGWDHYVSDGEYLGDSSVAIYFNPVVLPKNSAMAVNTYYGTGIGLATGGTSNGIDNIKISEKDFAVYVFDNKTNDVVANASVTLDGIGTVKTGDNGLAIFSDGIDFAKEYIGYTISHNDYKQKTGVVCVQRGKAASVYLKSVNDNTPEIIEAKLTSEKSDYNNKDLLNSNVYFNSNEEKTKVTKDNSYTIQLNVKSDMEDCTYQLISGEKVIKKSVDGKFELTALTSDGKGRTFTRHRIVDFSVGKKIYVQAISKDGTTSKKTLLGIKVSAPSSFATNITNDVSFTPKISLEDLGGASKICSILFGTKELDISEDKKLPLEISIDQDGKVRAAYNLNVFEKGWQSAEDDYAKIIANRTSAAKAFGGKPNSFGMGNAKVNFSVAGYGEGYVKDGAITINLGVYATLSGDVSYTHTFFLGVVPVYIKVGASAELKAELGATIVNDNKFTFKITTGVFEPSFSIYAEAGAGISGMLSAGVQGKGSLIYKNDFAEDYQNVSLTASASIELHAFLYSDSIRIAQKTWTLYDSNNVSRTYSLSDAVEGEEYVADSFYLTSRDYLEAPRSGDIYEWQTGTYTNARPVMVEANGTLYRLWIDDDTTRTSVNRTALMCSVYDNEYEYWETPFILDNDNTADFAFDVVANGSDVYVVYQEAKKTYTEEEAETLLAEGATGLATMAKDSVITMLRVSGGNVTDLGAVSNGVTVDEVEMGSMLPKVSVNGNTISVVWMSNSKNDVLAENDDAENYIWRTKSTINSSGIGAFDTPKYISLGTVPVTMMDVGNINGNASLCYVVDTDRDFSTLTDRKLYYVDGMHNASYEVETIATIAEPTSDPNPMFTKIDGKDSLVWFDNGNYRYFSQSPEEVFNVFEDDSALINTNNGYAVLQGQNSCAIVWCAASSDSNEDNVTYSLYAIKMQNGIWGIPYEVGLLSSYDTPFIASLTGYLDDENRCNVSYSVVAYDDYDELMASSLYQFVEYNTAKFEVQYLDYDIMEAFSGNTLPVVAAIKNTGTSPITNVSLEFAESNYNCNVASNPIIPGETREVSFMVEVPYDIGYGEQYAYVYVDTNYEQYVSPSNTDTLLISTNCSDVSVSQGETVLLGNAEYYTFVISNQTGVEENNLKFKVLLDDSENGAVIHDQIIDTLAPKEKMTVQIKKDLFGTSTVAYGHLVIENEEINYENNRVLICNNVEAPDTISLNNLTVKSSDVTKGDAMAPDDFVADGNGGYVKSIGTNEKIEISAEPIDDNYVFVNWELEGTGLITDKYAADTTYYMGDGDAVLTAKFMQNTALTSITLPGALQLGLGETYTFEPSVLPQNTTDHILWSSDNTDIVTIDEDGYVTATGKGTTTVRAVSSGNSNIVAETVITVKDVEIQEICMVYPSYVIDGVGKDEEINIICLPANATENVVYESADTSVVTVNDEGIMTSVGSGTTTVIAKSESGDVVATATVTVTQTLERVYFEETDLGVRLGQSQTISFMTDPVDAVAGIDPENIIWRSSNSDVISVTPSEDKTSAVIKSLNVGSSIVTVTVNGMFAAVINVTSKVIVDEFNIVPEQLEMLVGTSQSIDYVVSPNELAGYVTWSSSNSDVAYVQDGVLYANGVGKAVISLELPNGTSDTCTVTVKPEETVVTDVSGLQSEHPYGVRVDEWWSYTVPGATQLAVVFSDDTETERSYDYIYLYDKEYNWLNQYSGTELSGQKIIIYGDTVKIRLTSDGSNERYGFRVVSVTPVEEFTYSTTARVISWKCSATGAISPIIEVVHDGKTLKQDVDYRITYTGDMVAIEGIGKYVGSFTIETGEPSLENAHTYTNSCDTTCDVCGAKRTTTHKYKTTTTKATFDKNGRIVKKCSVCFKTVSTTINYVASVKLSTSSCTYNGKVRTPSVVVKDSAGKTLKKGVDYTVTYPSGRKNVGTYKIVVNMIGNYSGTKTLTFKINPIDISTCKVNLSATGYTYNGKVRTPSVTVKNASGSTLTKGTHYTVTYASGRKNAGTYKVTIKMIGNYTGTKTLTFKIKPIDISTCKVNLSAIGYTYNGKVRTPSVTVKNASGSTLTKGTHYTVTYASGRKNVGTYKVTIKMIGNYTGTKTLTFKINPVKTTISKLTPGTKKIVVNIAKKSSQVTGYQVQYSTSKSFTNAVTRTLANYDLTKYTISGLSANKTYFVRVRTYKKVGEKTYYSAWSSYKSAKTK